MRFVAGRDAVAELLARALQRRAIGKMLLAGAPWRSCWSGRCSEDPSGRCWWPGAAAERLAGRGAVAEAAGWGAVAKKLATPWQRAIGKKLLTRGAAVAKMLQAGAPGGRYLIQQKCHVQKAYLQRSNC